VANGVYEFEAVLSVGTTADNNGNRYAVNFDSPSGCGLYAIISGSTTSTTDRSERMNTLNGASTSFVTTASQSGGIVIRGIITISSTGGGLTIRHQHLTAGTSTVYIGSYLKVKRIS
jgi:hypothetical protein